MPTDLGYLPRLSRREDYVDFLEGYAIPTVADLEEGQSSRKLVKTYMLETVGHGAPSPALADSFSGRVRLDRLDDSLFRVHDSTHEGRVTGLLEAMDDRHPVLYTTLAAQDSDKWVRQVVDHNPWLDRLWLSSTILYQLWQYVQNTTPSHRYVRLVSNMRPGTSRQTPSCRARISIPLPTRMTITGRPSSNTADREFS